APSAVYTLSLHDALPILGVLIGIATLMTVGVYGLVAGIVKLDDFGLYLSRSISAFARSVGTGILRMAPWLMKGLAVAGTAAMFLDRKSTRLNSSHVKISY